MRNFFMWLEEWALDDESLFMAMGKCFLIISIFLAIFIVPFMYLDSQQTHIVLNKSEWECSHSRTVMMPISAGKTIMMMPEEECDAYRMRGNW